MFLQFYKLHGGLLLPQFLCLFFGQELIVLVLTAKECYKMNRVLNCHYLFRK